MARVEQDDASVALLGDANRSALYIHNDAGEPLRVKVGGTGAAADDYRWVIPAGYNGEWTAEQGHAIDGPVWGIWDGAGSGAAQVEQA